MTIDGLPHDSRQIDNSCQMM